MLCESRQFVKDPSLKIETEEVKPTAEIKEQVTKVSRHQLGGAMLLD
jgi:hypothetical protein